MQTASSYLFPWGIAMDIQEGVEAINKDSDGFALPPHLHVRYSIFKYDDAVSGAALEQSAKDALARMMRNVKEVVNKKVHDLRAGMFLEEEKIDDGKDPFRTARSNCAKARATARDCRQLALMFNLTDQLEAGFLAFEAWIETKKLLVNELEAQADELTKIESGENVTQLDKFKGALAADAGTPATASP